MSDRLRQSLVSSRSEIVAGLAEAEAELARVRQRAAELEELIALGTATLLAAEMISGGAKGSPEPAADASAPEPEFSAHSEVSAVAEPEPSDDVDPGPSDEVAAEPAQGATYEDDLRALLERAQP
ncbi:MAG TPA: hypothetical protein VFZ96_10655 [Actinomycetota bacterium]|nr:hypothetical protein [Actinomycetota bacterium]